MIAFFFFYCNLFILSSFIYEQSIYYFIVAVV